MEVRRKNKARRRIGHQRVRPIFKVCIHRLTLLNETQLCQPGVRLKIHFIKHPLKPAELRL